MEYSKVAARLREQIGRFSGELSKGLPKVSERLVSELVYGIQASQSVVLTKVGRALEENISIKKTEERLSRQLGRSSLGSIVQHNLLKEGSSRIHKDTLLIFDPSDLRKKYAKKMENLCTIRDGSEKKLGTGDWLCHVVGAELRGKSVVPLYGGLYSTESSVFMSKNREWLSVIDSVSKAVSRRGIWVIDRGGDRNKVFGHLLDKKLRFLIRMVGSRRHLEVGGKGKTPIEIALSCCCPYTETIVREKDGKEKIYHISFGYKKVHLPGRAEALYLLVVKGIGAEPLMLLTTELLRRNQKILWRMVRCYFRRWAIEETIRFIKQSYEIEDVRVLGYRRLQNLLPLVTAAAYFVAVVLDTKAKLKVMAGYVFKAAKRLFGIPDFRYYAIADGLMSIFNRHPGIISPKSQPINQHNQLMLFGRVSP